MIRLAEGKQAKKEAYLQVLFSVKDDRLGLHLAVLDVHLVAGEDDGNILADAHQITMPVGNVFVCDARRDVKHDDGTFTWGERKEKERCKKANTLVADSRQQINKRKLKSDI